MLLPESAKTNGISFAVPTDAPNNRAYRISPTFGGDPTLCGAITREITEITALRNLEMNQ